MNKDGKVTLFCYIKTNILWFSFNKMIQIIFKKPIYKVLKIIFLILINAKNSKNTQNKP